MDKNERKMWMFPWRYKESIAITTGLIIIGFILQSLLGKFNFYLFSSPVNLIFGGLIILFLILFSFARKTVIYQWFSGVPFAVSLIGGLLVLGIVMGLTPQFVKVDPHDHSIFTQLGFRQVTSAWPFVLVYMTTLISLGSLIVRRLIAFNIRDYAFYLNHIGLWILLFSAGLGAADIKRYVMHVQEGELEWRVYSENGDVLELPIAIQLNDFVMEEYMPKLAIIDRQTGDVQSRGSKPEYLQLEDKRPEGELCGWNIKMEEYIHEAVRKNDSTYHYVPMPGSTPAARITASNLETGITHAGWVCGGSMAQLYMTLPLDSQYCIVMTQTEPKRFMSDINVFEKDGREAHTELEVNKPLKMGDWMIYQYGYDNQVGKASSYSSFELVYDPWIYPAYAGIILLALGSICLLWSGNKKERNMTWNEYLWFAIPAMICWIAAGALVYKCNKKIVIDILMVLGIAIFGAFIIGLWFGQERPPLRTIGETRLWYSFFLALIGYITYKHWKYDWLLSFSSLVACVFVCINIFKPEIHSTNLMPALQSYWFVPHVTVYILSYSMLGAATIAAFMQLYKISKNKIDDKLYLLMDNVVYIGFGFLMLGMLMGAVWAKEAWGHYWSWDPKETWAFITSAAYLVYIHMRLQKFHPKFVLWMLPIAFLLLMITWIGVNYLPAAQGSIHTYSN